MRYFDKANKARFLSSERKILQSCSSYCFFAGQPVWGEKLIGAIYGATSRCSLNGPTYSKSEFQLLQIAAHRFARESETFVD
jgi:hypothetical protein